MARGLTKRAQLKAGLLIAPKEHWPPFEGGLAMELAGVNSDGRQTFRYTHSASYHVSLQICYSFTAVCFYTNMQYNRLFQADRVSSETIC